LCDLFAAIAAERSAARLFAGRYAARNGLYFTWLGMSNLSQQEKVNPLSGT
jgi:hypothetical protein